jgi:hypothetical protein
MNRNKVSFVSDLKMLGRNLILLLCISASVVFAQQSNQVELGKLETGATVSFVRAAKGKWGIEIFGGVAPRITQRSPVRIEVFQKENDLNELSTGYTTVLKSGSEIDASAEITYGKKVVFHVHDTWNISRTVLSVRRKVDVVGNAPGGFNSSIVFMVDSAVSWNNVNCMAPGAIYGDPTYNGDRSPGGKLNYEARRFFLREDMLPAPLFALSFSNGFSVAMLDPSPNGASTDEETKLVKNNMTDARFQFGAFGTWQKDENPIEFGFQFPGTISRYTFGPNAGSQPIWFRRFHPISQGVNHSYEINFRFGNKESFSDVTRNTWRWAWNTLKPAVTPIDVNQVRRVLTDHLANQAATIDGRTGIPFAVATFDTTEPQWNWTMCVMGFVSKNIECANQLLLESDRDANERGKKMRRIGLNIISSMINALSKIPLEQSGYDLATGKPWIGDHQEWLAPFIRNATEGMRVLVQAYQRERKLGHAHPEWLSWVKKYVDWLILQQRDDGSFPRRWKSGSSEVVEQTGSTSYCPVPLLILMSEETGDPKYMQSAIHSAEYVWKNWGEKELFVGGTCDNPNITDKEAGMLSLEAYLSLYESTKDTKWLERAKVAADYAESWMWIWNLPMPVDADNAKLHWKKGVPTIGLQGISARGPGGADEYLDWSAPSYAKLYSYTKDEHYLYVARVLLHDTKSMVALPGRQYDMKGIGWQQEHWSMGPGRNGRGRGGHRFWLPWVSANHLHSITGMYELNPDLYQKLFEGN